KKESAPHVSRGGKDNERRPLRTGSPVTIEIEKVERRKAYGLIIDQDNCDSLKIVIHALSVNQVAQIERDMEEVTFTGRICGSSFKKGVKSYNMQGNTLKVFSGKVEITEKPDSAPAIIGDTIRFLYNTEPHVGTVVKEVVTRKLLHVS